MRGGQQWGENGICAGTTRRLEPSVLTWPILVPHYKLLVQLIKEYVHPHELSWFAQGERQRHTAIVPGAEILCFVHYHLVIEAIRIGAVGEVATSRRIWLRGVRIAARRASCR